MLDLLGDSDSTLRFYCIHDADSFGTRIFQALQEETAARRGRKVEVVNLGLEPAEALNMGLEVEKVVRKGKKAATVGGYVEPKWREWLQGNRVELNAMTSPQFLAWLDPKLEANSGKVIPPADVLRAQVEGNVRELYRAGITAEVLAREDVPGRVDRAVRSAVPAILGLMPTIESDVARHLDAHPADHWIEPIGQLAESIVCGVA